METLIVQGLALLSLTTLGVLLIITGYREFKLRKKVELLKHIIDCGYEHENVDINNL